MSGCWGEPVYKSKTESYYCEEHKIAFYCEVCGIDVWRDGNQHDESKCDDTGEKWYCPNCDEKSDDEDDDGGWCNEDCEKAEGCIECNPMAFCSAETFAKWQDDCVSRMKHKTSE